MDYLYLNWIGIKFTVYRLQNNITKYIPVSSFYDMETKKFRPFPKFVFGYGHGNECIVYKMDHINYNEFI